MNRFNTIQYPTPRKKRPSLYRISHRHHNPPSPSPPGERRVTLSLLDREEGTPILVNSYSERDESRGPSRSLPLKLSRYTPVNIVRKPPSSDMEVTSSVTLNPLKRINDAVRTAVVKVT